MGAAAEKLGQSAQIEAALGVLAVYLRETSAELAGQLFQTPGGTESFDPPRTELVYAERMSLVFVAGPSLRILFRAHYDPSLSASIALGGETASDEVRVSAAYTGQLMQEFANLVAGRCKSMLDQKEIETGLSLPLTTGGVDEIFFRYMKGSPYMRTTSWGVKPKRGDIRLTLSSSIEILDATIVEKILQETESQQRTGELDLF